MSHLGLKRAVLIAAASALLAVGGCESTESARMRAGETTDGPGLQVELCRKLSKKGKRLDVGHDFVIGEKAAVLAFADFTDLVPGRAYTAHLVWIRPDGRELFRRFAEFSLSGADDAWKATVLWKDALDLLDVKQEELAAATPSVTLDSTFNISTEREREPGTYRFRVYLDRRLVREESFTVAPFQEVPTG